MADISKITLPSGSTYNIKDQVARDLIDQLSGYTTYLGVTTTALTDGSSTNPIVINGEDVTAKKGDIANYGSKEFIFSGIVWQEFGDMGALGALAYKDEASGSYQPGGTVSQPTFTGTAEAVSVSATYTPTGSINTPTITVTPITTTVNSITDVGTLPTLTTTVTDENLTLSWSAGTLPTKASDTTVATGIQSAVSSALTFTGDEDTIDSDGSFTPHGTVSQPTFTGTTKTVTVS